MGGMLLAGWLLGGAAAHGDVAPVEPVAGAVAEAIGQAEEVARSVPRETSVPAAVSPEREEPAARCGRACAVAPDARRVVARVARPVERMLAAAPVTRRPAADPRAVEPVVRAAWPAEVLGAFVAGSERMSQELRSPRGGDESAWDSMITSVGARADRRATTDTSPAQIGGRSPSSLAEAMAGRGINGQTTGDADPRPFPRDAGQSPDLHGFVPQSFGGASQHLPVAGDVARMFDPARQMTVRAPLASHLPPAVRTAADEPSFSPD
ncbi:hypothetical protein [Bailinhaonella thermotolerans]|uniref:hypothetical protein n=1 Tax=Bailinhaonella thermotolerans TaxID=1070861 RepID=UPI0011C4A865|nr:hypothetical protein [Bailinhaonella thermotolerans]